MGRLESLEVNSVIAVEAKGRAMLRKGWIKASWVV